MATKKSEKIIAHMTERVNERLFKDTGKYSGDLTVLVNGVAYKIQRGKDVKIPRFVKEVIEASQKQDTETANMISNLEDDYNSKVKKTLS